MAEEADICLFLEGTYPYITGGVSSWTHALIKAQSHLKFSLVCLLPPDFQPELRYTLPDNVVSIQNIHLQRLPEGVKEISEKEESELFNVIERNVLNIQYRAKTKHLEEILNVLDREGEPLGEEILLNSLRAWRMLVRMYNSAMGDSSFLNYFWSWKGLLSGFYTVLLAEMPKAKVYHALCTGYGGLFLARAKAETGKPCLLTEHGIYTNERRIEITAAQWLNDFKAMDLAVDKPMYIRDLKDFWVDTFEGYSRLTYQAADEIITLYEGNKEMQIMDGAEPEKISIIPNGIDIDSIHLKPRPADNPPTIALIGRVVPVKDVKSFIQAANLVREQIPHLKAYILGAWDEDEHYYFECLEMVEEMGLKETVEFTGLVDINDYLGKIDVLVLSSISEVQPLSVLEAGAVGIPSVATNVGAISEMLTGRSDEEPRLGPAGAICPLAHPQAIAEEVTKLLTEPEHYEKCSQAAKERVHTYYQAKDQDAAYEALYQKYIDQSRTDKKVESLAWQG